MEHPAAVGVPELIRIISEDDGNGRPIYLGNQGDDSEEETDFSSDNSGFLDRTVDDSGYDSSFSEPTFPPNIRPQQEPPPQDGLPAQRQGLPEDDAAGRSSLFNLWPLLQSMREDWAFSASGPHPSRKRSGYESDEEQPAAKRSRKSYEESFREEEFSQEPTPSTSDLCLPSKKWSYLDLTVGVG